MLPLVATLLMAADPAPTYRFVEEPGKHVDLMFGDRKVIRYMNAPRDASTKDSHELTFKPFHHVFDPETGTVLLTNGAGLAADKANLYPHHRGLFFAFNKIDTGTEKDVDVWHGKKNEYVLHEKMLEQEATGTVGRHKALLTWHGRAGTTFATEHRELTVRPATGGTQIDFTSTLTTDRPQVKLDGDPQHAGFHFRAAMEVAQKTKGETYYLRPDGKGKPGETRNWEPKTGKGPIDLPWNAMSFVGGGKRYTVVRIDHPSNPKPARGSERDYGRFGDYFQYTLTPTNPLTVRYRVWVQSGETTVEKCDEMAKAFVGK